jgi:hypothetical protein
MSHMRLWAAAAIITLAIIIGFIFSVPRARDGAHPAKTLAATVTPPVSLHDVFKKGVHTITGSVETPTACSAVTASASLTPGDTPTIQVALTLATSEGVCLQLPTLVKFSTTVTAPARTPITATVDGAVATTTVL